MEIIRIDFFCTQLQKSLVKQNSKCYNSNVKHVKRGKRESGFYKLGSLFYEVENSSNNFSNIIYLNR